MKYSRMIIYKITNLITGKIYVGKCVKESISYFGSGVAIKAAIKKYGRENFIKEVIEICSTLFELGEREKFWIKFLNTRAPFGYNLTDGGDGLINPSDETKRKMSEKVCKAYEEGRLHTWNKGRPWSKEERNRISSGTRIGMSDPMLRKQLSESAYKRTSNRKHSDASKQKLSISLAGRPKTKEHREKIINLSQSYKVGHIPWNKGQTSVYSDETRRHISNSLKGRRLSEETKKKISCASRGKAKSDAHRLHIKESWILRRLQ